MEIQRLGSIAPMAVPHRALETIEFRGYTIPKDSIIISSLYSILRDLDSNELIVNQIDPNNIMIDY